VVNYHFSAEQVDVSVSSYNVPDVWLRSTTQSSQVLPGTPRPTTIIVRSTCIRWTYNRLLE